MENINVSNELLGYVVLHPFTAPAELWKIAYEKGYISQLQYMSYVCLWKEFLESKGGQNVT